MFRRWSAQGATGKKALAASAASGDDSAALKAPAGNGNGTDTNGSGEPKKEKRLPTLKRKGSKKKSVSATSSGQEGSLPPAAVEPAPAPAASTDPFLARLEAAERAPAPSASYVPPPLRGVPSDAAGTGDASHSSATLLIIDSIA